MMELNAGSIRGIVQDADDLVRNPELSLMLAVLEDAIACYHSRGLGPRDNLTLLRRQALDWLTREDWASPFSFANVCEALSLDLLATRERIMGRVRAQMA